MSSRFCQCSSLHLLIGLFIFGSISAILAHENEDPTIKTMEAFSGYPIHESNSLVSDFVSSLSVETQTLQNQIDELSTFSDAPAPSVTRILYTEKDVLARSRSGFKPKRSLEVIMFTSEEPTRFGISCLGSRLLAGIETLANNLKSTVDGQNISFLGAARSAGYANDQDDLSSVFLKKGS
ncbi:hypothetical protein LWI29_030010 [Acer saccharum]|uniref:Uncharacterized protein n=1 Tax=Acer saccharum TaxID=4024 RepID=A0AA39TED2_ACESA|nr:hypothetical protein LWI29_030010 [Acer saccharum]